MSLKKEIIFGSICVCFLFSIAWFGVKWLVRENQTLNSNCVSNRKVMEDNLYTNLLDEESQEIVSNLMQDVGIEQTAINTFLEWVNDYNERVDKVEELKEGFHPFSDLMQPDYSEVFLKSRYLENGEMQMDPNCRLVSYLLFSSMVTSDYTYEEDNYLMYDVYAMETDPVFERQANHINQFITLFQPVKVQNDSSVAQHEEAILADWKNRGLKFQTSDDVSLITIFLHDYYENKRYVAHSGIKMNVDGAIWFAEKYSSGKPYQCTKFVSDKELVDYLLSRADIYQDGTEGKPIILENDKVISS